MLVFFRRVSCHYKKTGGFCWPKSSEIRRNRPIPTNFWRNRPSVSFRRKKKFVGISSELPTTFWRIPRNVILTNFRRYYDADTRDQSSSEKLRTDGERSSDTSDVECSSVHSDEPCPSVNSDERGSSVNSDGYMSVGIFRRPLSVGIYPFFFQINFAFLYIFWY